MPSGLRKPSPRMASQNSRLARNEMDSLDSLWTDRRVGESESQKSNSGIGLRSTAFASCVGEGSHGTQSRFHALRDVINFFARLYLQQFSQAGSSLVQS